MSSANAGISRRGFVRSALLGAVGTGAFMLGACSVPEVVDDGLTSVILVSDTGGINDQSFNQISWEGMKRLGQEDGWNVSYIESKQGSDYGTNLDKAADQQPELIWAVGYAMADAANEVADQNPDIMFGIIEGLNIYGSDNLVGTSIRSQEPAFVVGYIAARMSKNGKVGFVGGTVTEVISKFEYGYYGGIAYANAKHGLKVESTGQYAESFSDSGKGKSIATKMITNGCDVLFHAAGGTGIGMIEACGEAGVWAIGVDTDQAYLAPSTVITSCLKRVDNIIYSLSKRIMSGEALGGKNIDLGAAEDAAGISETHDLIPNEIYNAAQEVFELIKQGDIVPPGSEETYKSYLESLQST